MLPTMWWTPRAMFAFLLVTGAVSLGQLPAGRYELEIAVSDGAAWSWRLSDAALEGLAAAFDISIGILKMRGPGMTLASADDTPERREALRKVPAASAFVRARKPGGRG